MFSMLPSIYVSLTAPVDHNPAWPVVVPNILGTVTKGGIRPFAYILALDPGQCLIAAPHQALGVEQNEGKWEYRFGAFATSGKEPIIQCQAVFPEILAKLKKPVKGMERLLNTRKSEKPWLHIKNWQEGDIEMELELGPLTPSVAVEILELWASWESRSLHWGERLDELGRVSEKNMEAYRCMPVNSFEKFCNSLGLRKGDKRNFEVQFQSLFNALHFSWDLVQHTWKKEWLAAC